MSTPITLKAKIPLRRTGPRGRHEIGPESGSILGLDRPRVPRVSRLMALAIHLDELIRSGAIKDQAEIARVGRVSRARVTQIMALLNLTPDLQQELLFLERAGDGRSDLILADLQPLSAIVSWREQRRRWVKLQAKH